METLLKKKFSFFLTDKVRAIVTEVIISFFILLFMYTATSKLFIFKDFDKVLSQVPLFGSFHLAIAALIPAVEIIIGALLIVPFTKKKALYATLILMIIFTCYLIYMVLFTIHLPCSCGGAIDHLSWQNHIWFNIILIALATFGILTNLNHKQP